MIQDTDTIKHKTIIGALWQFLQQASSLLVSFGVSVVLARLLSPTDFGTVALTGIFISVASVLVDSGLGTSLIQKKEVDALDYDTVFYASMGLSAILYAILFAVAPLIGAIYEQPQVASILRVLGIALFLSGITNVQRAAVIRRMDYKKFFIVTLISSITSGVVGLTLASLGWGVWALVASNLTTGVASIVCLDFIVRWRPHLRFSWQRLKVLYSFGLNLLGASLIGSFFNELRGFLIGLRYQPASLAFYNRGDGIPSIINRNITGIANGVLFPAMSKLQDDKQAVKAAMRRSIKTCTFIIAPTMLLLAVIADKVVLLLYTEKWMMAVPFMRLLCISYILSIIGDTNLYAMMAVGRSDTTFRLEFVKKPIYLAILLYTMTISPLAMAAGTVVYSVIGTIINASPNKKLIQYGYVEQMRDILPPIIAASFAALAALFVGQLAITPYLLLGMQLAAGLTTYWLLAHILHLESYQYIRSTLIQHLKGENN